MPSLQFTEQDWARVEQNTTAWWNGELDRPLVYLSVRAPLTGAEPFGYHSNYPIDMPADQVVDRYVPSLEATRFYADAFPWIWVNFGPGILSGFLGAEVNSVTEPGETVWFNPPEHRTVENLDLQYDPENAWWRRVQHITAAFVDRFGPLLQVSHTDLGGNLDVLASFVTTEQLLLDVIDRPEAVLRQVNRITGLWLRYYDALDQLIRPTCPGTSTWTPIWSPGRTYMLQSDFSYMISPRMFERFVIPDLTAICDRLDHAFYHLDGKGEIPHLPLLLDIPRLRGIQWIPGDGQPSPDQWLPLLKRIRDGGKLCQVFVTAEGALRITRELGGKGFLFVIQTSGDEFQNPEEVQAFLNAVGWQP